MTSPILAVVDDLFFLAKIQQTAQLLGVPIEPVDPKQLQQRIAQSSARSVIVDLNHRSGAAVDIVRTIKADPSLGQRIQVLGFLSHVQTDLAAAARAAGCDILLARSAFSQQLPQRLKQLADLTGQGT